MGNKAEWNYQYRRGHIEVVNSSTGKMRCRVRASPVRSLGAAFAARALFPRAQRFTAMPCISNRALSSSVPAPMNARAGNSFLK
jgi:hypothetical protein